tara:strand:- start:765 stop:899 length:135 start_codon:yes stop_codon:yes gene_type:complete
MKSKQLKIIIISVLNIGMHHFNLNWITIPLKGENAWEIKSVPKN